MMRYLGEVEHIFDDVASARIKPYAAIAEGLQCRETAREEFPNEGYVFWRRVPREAQERDLVLFELGENLPGKKDIYQANEVGFATEVIDLLSYADIELARRAVCEGLALVAAPTRPVWLWCAGDILVGPVRLARDESGRWTLETAARHQVPWVKVMEADIYAFHTRSGDRMVLIGSLDRGAEGYFDWDDDARVVRRALDLGKNLTEVADRVGNTKKALTAVAESLATVGDHAELSLYRYRVERALALTRDVERAGSLAGDLAQALQSLPAVQERLAAVTQEMRQALLDSMNTELKEEREELEARREERRALETEIEALTEAADKARQAGQTLLSELDGEVEQRIRDVLSRPAQLLAEAAMLRPFLATDRPAPEAPSASISTVAPWKTGSLLLTTPTQLLEALTANLRAKGLSSQLARQVYAAFGTGGLPILAGPCGLDAFQAFADTVAGGRMAIVHVGPGVLESGDLFGRLDSATGRFMPHPAALIDWVATAAESEGYAVVVLEGINRAPIESYLLPLLQAIKRRDALRLFHPQSLPLGAAYAERSTIEWPHNLLLAATLTEGPTTLPLSGGTWEHSLLVQTDLQALPRAVRQVPNARPSDLAPHSMLLALGDSTDDPTRSLFDELSEAIESPRLRTVFGRPRNIMARYARALRHLGAEEEAAVSIAIQGALLPCLTDLDPEAYREALAAIGHADVTIERSLEGLSEAVRARLS